MRTMMVVVHTMVLVGAISSGNWEAAIWILSSASWSCLALTILNEW